MFIQKLFKKEVFVLISLNKVLGHEIQATDNVIRKVRQFLFDDDQWVVRYLVVDTGNFLSRKDVLISLMSMKKIVWHSKKIEVSMTKDQIEKSPDIDTQKPVSRQHEQVYFSYYGWPGYWGYAGPWSMGLYGIGYPPGQYTDRFLANQVDLYPKQSEQDSHLRSSKEVTGYGIDATDGSFGHVEDFIFDDQSWTIRYLVIDTKNYWPSPSAIIASDWIRSINWSALKVAIELNGAVVKSAPEFNTDVPVTRDYEKKLYQFYKRIPYWLGEQKLSKMDSSVVAHTAGAELPDPSARRVGKEVLTREDGQNAIH
jgi:hypothetical protein